jgi:alpha-glucosidase
MGYAEADNAQELIEKFVDDCNYHNIPCDLLHLSSGYTVDAQTGDRNVFTWNHNRFPNPSKMFEKLRENGIKTVANVKPWLLTQHPNYKELADRKGFVCNNTSPSITRLWSSSAGFCLFIKVQLLPVVSLIFQVMLGKRFGRKELRIY